MPISVPYRNGTFRSFVGTSASFLWKTCRTRLAFASNLGSVELTVALHRVYDPMKDRILFDVGHQSYVHKILTGRRDSFDTLRQLDGISGFPKPCESNADPFLAGHASDSVSLAAGMARARTLMHGNYDVVAVVGDGAMTGGLCFEGLSDLGASPRGCRGRSQRQRHVYQRKCRRAWRDCSAAHARAPDISASSGRTAVL